MPEVKTDELFMSRALELAQRARGQVSPNPMVGCVIVTEGKIISEGYHQRYGGPHAEVEAINALKNKTLLKGADIYVNLEPCSHFGKTPPCADLIASLPFKRLIIANKDSNPLVAGKGIQKIKEAGIEVVENVLAKEGRLLNERFFAFMEKKRPYIILKWAQTTDKFIARKDYSSKWISNDLSRKLVHKWRSEEDAIMVGTNTVLYDNPRLNVREWSGKQPVRIFIDKELKLKKDYHVFDQSQETICFNLKKNENQRNLSYVQVSQEKFLEDILAELYQRKIQSLFVEGGKVLLETFIQAGLWDEIRLFKSSQRFNEGISSPEFKGTLVEEDRIESDILQVYKNSFF